MNGAGFSHIFWNFDLEFKLGTLIAKGCLPAFVSQIIKKVLLKVRICSTQEQTFTFKNSLLATTLKNISRKWSRLLFQAED